jgi:hypothetical protein
MSCEVFEAEANRPKIASAPVTGATANVFFICQRDRRVSRLRDGRCLTHGSPQRSDTKPAATIARYSISAPPVLTDLALARGDGRHLRLDAAARHDLLEILNDRTTGQRYSYPGEIISQQRATSCRNTWATSSESAQYPLFAGTADNTREMATTGVLFRPYYPLPHPFTPATAPLSFAGLSWHPSGPTPGGPAIGNCS